MGNDHYSLIVCWIPERKWFKWKKEEDEEEANENCHWKNIWWCEYKSNDVGDVDDDVDVDDVDDVDVDDLQIIQELNIDNDNNNNKKIQTWNETLFSI